ncbi:MAG: four helix bundle protein [Anaerolineales bacterium]|nr:four helix bundle protein [Anaerolineales bacterium]
MTTLKNFEELESWKKARELAGYIYALTRKEKFSRDFGLRDQIQRAAGSIMHNIAEGFEAGYNAEFVRFLKMARRSAGEVQSELYLALDADYINEDELKKAYELTIEIKKLINGLITYLNKTVTNKPKTS